MRGLFVCRGRDLRDVLTVSTQPVDKTVSKLIVQLSPSDGIQVLSFTRWNSTNLGYSTISICADFLLGGCENLHGELSLPLQEGGVRSDELLRLDVLNSNTTHFVGLECWEREGLVGEVYGLSSVANVGRRAKSSRSIFALCSLTPARG